MRGIVNHSTAQHSRQLIIKIEASVLEHAVTEIFYVA
jgi:hypothetical protein